MGSDVVTRARTCSTMPLFVCPRRAGRCRLIIESRSDETKEMPNG
jgi:hypothetical protein